MFHDVNAAIQAAIHARMQGDSYLSRVSPGKYRSGAVAYCPAKAALGSRVLPGLGLRSSKVPDYRYMLYGEWIHRGVQGVLTPALRGQSGTWFFPEVWSNAMYELPTGTVSLSSRADGLLATKSAPNKWVFEVIEMKTQNLFQIIKRPEQLPYPWHRMQALLAFYGTRAGARDGVKLYVGDPPHQTCINDELRVQPGDEIEMCSSILFFPREVARSGKKEPGLQEIAQWFTLRRQYTEADNDKEGGRVMEYLSDWDRIYRDTVDGTTAVEAVDELMGKWGIPAPIHCENCEVLDMCPMRSPGAYKKLFEKKDDI